MIWTSNASCKEIISIYVKDAIFYLNYQKDNLDKSIENNFQKRKDPF